MITIFKLLNGDEIIGEISDPLLTNQEFYSILKPMSIIDSTPEMEELGYGGMRLRDTLLLSDDEEIKLVGSCVIATYSPSDALLQYYTKARTYYRKYTKKEIDSQIQEATDHMVRAAEQREQRKNEHMEQMIKHLLPKGKLH